MKHTFIKHSVLLSLLCVADLTVRAQSTAFTYQGRLTSGNVPANGSHDFQFSLFNAESGGNPVQGPVTFSGVGVSNGLFTVSLNFNEDALFGPEHWLALAVRPAGNGAFTSLNPRQLLTATPYAIVARTALTALNANGHSLHAADGSSGNAVFVDNNGRVGVGTAVPSSQLHVVSQPNEAAPPRLQSTGNNRFNAGWDFYHGGTGRGYVGVPDAGAPVAPGEMVLFGGQGTKVSLWSAQVRTLTADVAGNVGIGTAEPAAKLDVRGDIRLGPNGQFRAASGEENLRIVRGMVSASGAILRGTGLQVAHDPNRRYFVTFDTPFTGAPVVTGAVDASTASSGGIFEGYVVVDNVTASSVEFLVYGKDSSGTVDRDFHFIAIGPR